MKKIKEAYIQGQSGEPLKSGGRVKRLAHKLGESSARTIAEQNAAIEQAESAHFQKAMEVTRGANRTAMQVIEAAARIPHQASSKPLWGVEKIEESGKKSREWNGSFIHVPSATEESFAGFASPVISNLGHLKIENMYWSDKEWFVKPDDLTSADDVRVPVDNVSIAVTSERDANGVLQPATTQIWLNARQYHAGNPEATKGQRERDYQREFGERVSLTLGQDGELLDLRVSTPNISGMVQLDAEKAKVDVEGFLQGVMGAVNETAAAYEQLQQGM